MRTISPTCGMRDQIGYMDAKIRALALAVMPDEGVSGRSSATGSPRLSITIAPPSAASRTSSEVCVCNSRTEIVLIGQYRSARFYPAPVQLR